MTQSHVLKLGNRRYEVEVGKHADRAGGSALLRSEDVHLLAVIDVALIVGARLIHVRTNLGGDGPTRNLSYIHMAPSF